MQQIIVPICICVVLPVAIVLIKYIATINKDNRCAEVLTKAIEANAGINVDRLAEALQKPKKSPRELLNKRLLRGCIWSLVGLACVMYGVVSLCAGVEYMNDIVNLTIFFGSIPLAVGLGNLIYYFVVRRQVASDEVAGEE